MPLLLDADRWDPATLRSQAEEHRKVLERMARAIADRTPPSIPNPFALESGLSLTLRSTELAGELLKRTDLDRATLFALVNQLYEVMVNLPLFVTASQSPPRPFPSPGPRGRDFRASGRPPDPPGGSA